MITNNNNGGNPNHDENGRFTSKENASSGKKPEEKVLNQMGLDKADFEKPSKKYYEVYFDGLGNTTEVVKIEANSEEEAKELAKEKRKHWSNYRMEPSNVKEAENPENVTEQFNSLKEECKQFVELFPWEENSKKNILKTIDECENADQLFWGFLFNFYDNDIQNEMKAKFPDAIDKLYDLSEKNKGFYGKLTSAPKKEWWEEDEDDYSTESETPLEEAKRKEREKAEVEDKEFKENNPYEDYDESDVGKNWRN